MVLVITNYVRDSTNAASAADKETLVYSVLFAVQVANFSQVDQFILSGLMPMLASVLRAGLAHYSSDLLILVVNCIDHMTSPPPDVETAEDLLICRQNCMHRALLLAKCGALESIRLLSESREP